MVYQIGGHDAGGWDEHPSSLSLFWQTSHGGAFVEEYRAGWEAGKTDLDAGTFDYLNILDSIEVSERGNIWHARLDGYKEATKERGPTKFG